MSDPDVLIQRYVEGVLSASEAEELHALLSARPELGTQLLRHLEMDAMLRASQDLATNSLRPPLLLPRRRFTVTALAGVAAVAACVTLTISWVGSMILKGANEDQEETTASVAVLTRGVNLVWESVVITPGTPLSPGWLKLKSGIAQIEFYQGARVMLEGPAEFELVSSGEANCTRGKLSAQVPPQAVGFRINTPKGTIVDLGTEFGLDVNAGSAEVHVFKGEVEVHSPATAMQELKEGQALSFADASTPMAADPAGFATLGELDARTADSQRSEFERWMGRSQLLNQDPSLRLRFDFQESAGARVLTNGAVNGRQIADGSIVGAGWTQGRWPGKGALEFRNVSDRVRLSVPGEIQSLTLAAWIRVNGLDRAFNSIFMSESWGERKIHWQITRDGVVRLGVAGAVGNPHVDYDSPAFFNPERFGRWIHLAVSFDAGTQKVSHYADGELMATLPLKDPTPLRVGMAELGNWNDRRQQGGVAIRHLSGAMDEFALWDRVLTGAEIAEMAK